MVTPEVTALIDTYNHESFLEQSILSVLEQGLSEEELEILVVDDGSTDGTAQLVAKFAPRVTYLPKENGGQASAFNVGLAAAHGEIVAFLDADDYWLPGKLPAVLDAFHSDESIGAIGHAIAVVEDGVTKQILAPRERLTLKLEDVHSARVFRGVKALLGSSRFSARRSVLTQVLPVPNRLRIEADEWLFTLAAAVGRLAVLETPLTAYRMHGGNLFQTGVTARLEGIRRALESLTDLLPAAMEAAGVPAEVREAVLEPVWLDLQRLRLTMDGGRRRETFEVERRFYRAGAPRTGTGAFARQMAALGLTFVLPPERYYGFRHHLDRGRKRAANAASGSEASTAPELVLLPAGVPAIC